MIDFWTNIWVVHTMEEEYRIIFHDLWWWLQQSNEYIHDTYCLKHHYFEWNFEYSDMEELCENYFSIENQWDISLPYSIWKSKNWYYVYFLIPKKYTDSIGGELDIECDIKKLPANINAPISDQVYFISEE